MATVDLVCTFDAANSDAWIDGENTSTNDDTSASITRNPYQLTKLGFTTDATTAIPSGAIKTAVQLIIRCRNTFATGKVYVKNPGEFTDGGAAAHTVTFTNTLTTYISIDIAAEEPSVLSDALTSGYIRMFHEHAYATTMYVDYVGLRVTYTDVESIPLLFMNENM